VFVDGTGVGFNTPFYAQFRRGAEIRRIRSHLKAVVLVYCRGGQRWAIECRKGIFEHPQFDLTHAPTQRV